MSSRVAIVCFAGLTVGLLVFGLSAALRAQPDAAAAPSAEPSAPSAPPGPPSANVTITIVVVPAVQATVTWGKKRLGIIKPRSSLVVTRPRDSGPLDLVVRANGYLAVQTRAFSFADGRLSVRLTPVDQKAMLLGYREELPEGGLDGGLDGGMPELPYDADAAVPLFGGDY